MGEGRGTATAVETTRLSRWRSIARPQTVNRVAWFAFPIAGGLLVATRLGRNWYHYDEWSIIDRTSSGAFLGDAFVGFQGHLHAWTHLVYWVQLQLFGLEGNGFVHLAFCASLVALQLSLAAVLFRLGVPTVLALLAATVVTFFGPGAQNMVFEFQLGANLALALCFAAAFVALREVKTGRAAALIAVLLVAAAGADSGLAVFGAVFVGVLVVLRWPRRLSLLALAPPLAVSLTWLALADQGEYYPVSIDAGWEFGQRLVKLAAGGLVGVSDTSIALRFSYSGPQPSLPLTGETAGLIALVVASACVIVGLVRHRLPRAVVASLVGGLLAAALGVIGIARTRAWLIMPAQLPGSRYLQWVAAFLLVAFVPALAATLRPSSVRAARVLCMAAAAAFVVVFAVNGPNLRQVRDHDENWGSEIKSSVRQALTVLREGCGDGREPDPGVLSIDGSPQINNALLERLVARGALTRDFALPPRPELEAAVCARPTPPP